jgi:hypothetical protein
MMTRTECRMAFVLVPLILMAVANRPAHATDTLMKVSFSGPHGLNGYFIYDPNLQGSGSFNFTGLELQDPHVTYVSVNGTSSTPYPGPGCDPFVITPSVNGLAVFELYAHGPPGTILTIYLATNGVLSSSALPTCSSNPFVSAPTGNQSTCTIQAVGTNATTYPITQVTCAPLLRPTVPSPQSYSYPCPSPAPCPVYVCQPRPTCCLSRLLGRGSLRLGCR